MRKILFVANEAIWPAVHGGRVRMAGIASALSEVAEVHTVEPDSPSLGVAPPTIASRSFVPGNPRGRSALRVLARGPRVGWACVGPEARARISFIAQSKRPDVVFLSHSYLHPRLEQELKTIGCQVAVDFQNIETDRFAAFSRQGKFIHRISARAEAWKARRWEPAVATTANITSAINERDVERLVRWGAHSVVMVANGTNERKPYQPSRPDAPVLYLASATYPPNVDGGELLLNKVWPQVRKSLPWARLWIAGRGTEQAFKTWNGRHGIEVLGFVDNPELTIRNCALFVGPVINGGGGQLKVGAAIAQHRLVVATQFSRTSIPTSALPHCPAPDNPGEMARDIVSLLENVSRRHSLERQLGNAVPTWSEAIFPLAEALGIDV